MKCTECDGRRVIVRMERQWWGSSRNGFDTGREVERLYQCERCKGSGVEPAPEPISAVLFNGAAIDAPGFTSETFAAGVAKAIAVGTLPINPAKVGGVLVQSTRTGEHYHVTRKRCSCPGGMSHGHCYHRAAVLYINDVAGVDVSRERILGFDQTGRPVTAAERAAEVLRTVDFATAPYTWIKYTEPRTEASYVVIDKRVDGGVTEYAGGGADVSHILKPAAIHSAHREFSDAFAAMERANAEFLGFSVEEVNAERERRTAERLKARLQAVA